MDLQFSLYNIILIIGITQGLITSVLLLLSRRNVKSSKFLALGLLAFCFLSVKSVLLTTGLWDMPYLRYFPNAAEVVLLPLFYFYFTYLLDPEFKWKKKHYLHFVPFFISQSLAIFIYIATLETTIIAEKEIISEKFFFNTLKQIDEYIALAMFVFYIPISYRILQRYRNWVKNYTSDNAIPDFTWLRNIFFSALLLGISLFVTHALDLFTNIGTQTEVHWRIINLFISFLIYYMGFVGYMQPHIDLREINVSTLTRPSSGITSDKEDDITSKLNHLLKNERVFLNPKISLKEIAEMMDMPQREISEVINHSFQQNFRDLINDFRVQEVKEQLLYPESDTFSIVGLAYDCGFNSEASFYRIFKKKTGMSPNEYKKKHSQKN